MLRPTRGRRTPHPRKRLVPLEGSSELPIDAPPFPAWIDTEVSEVRVFGDAVRFVFLSSPPLPAANGRTNPTAVTVTLGWYLHYAENLAADVYGASLVRGLRITAIKIAISIFCPRRGGSLNMSTPPEWVGFPLFKFPVLQVLFPYASPPLFHKTADD